MAFCILPQNHIVNQYLHKIGVVWIRKDLSLRTGVVSMLHASHQAAIILYQENDFSCKKVVFFETAVNPKSLKLRRAGSNFTTFHVETLLEP